MFLFDTTVLSESILKFFPSNFDAQTVQLFFELAPDGLCLWCGMDPRQLMHILVSGELRYSKWLGAVVQVTSGCVTM